MTWYDGVAALATSLKLPPWNEARRGEIEAAVLPIEVKPARREA